MGEVTQDSVPWYIVDGVARWDKQIPWTDGYVSTEVAGTVPGVDLPAGGDVEGDSPATGAASKVKRKRKVKAEVRRVPLILVVVAVVLVFA